MSASPKFVPVQHFDQANAVHVYNSVMMTSPERKKDLVLPREVENGIHNDMARYVLLKRISNIFSLRVNILFSLHLHF